MTSDRARRAAEAVDALVDTSWPSIDDLAALIDEQAGIGELEAAFTRVHDSYQSASADYREAVSERDAAYEKIDILNAAEAEMARQCDALAQQLANAQHAAFDLQQRIEAAVAYINSGEVDEDDLIDLGKLVRILRGEER